jgi:hypothetical protein
VPQRREQIRPGLNLDELLQWLDSQLHGRE